MLSLWLYWLGLQKFIKLTAYIYFMHSETKFSSTVIACICGDYIGRLLKEKQIKHIFHSHTPKRRCCSVLSDSEQSSAAVVDIHC